MTGVFIIRIQIQRHTERRRPCEETEVCSHVVTNQGMPRTEGNHQKVEEARKGSSLELLEEACPS